MKRWKITKFHVRITLTITITTTKKMSYYSKTKK